MAADLGSHVTSFLTHRLNGSGPFAFLAVGAPTRSRGENGRVINALLIATGINSDCQREVRGAKVVTSATGATSNTFIADLVTQASPAILLRVMLVPATLQGRSNPSQRIRRARSGNAQDPPRR